MTKENHALEQARAQLESIVEMVAAIDCDYARLEELSDERARLACDVDESHGCATFDIELANLEAWDRDNKEELAQLRKDANGCENDEQARERIQEDPLSVLVRAGWHTPGTVDVTPEEFEILLCTGGPAVRIRGELNDALQPSRAWIEYQDWGTPWTEYLDTTSDEQTIIAHDRALMTYCNSFYFGE